MSSCKRGTSLPCIIQACADGPRPFQITAKPAA
ncbi:hypothetical protein FOPG_19808, partial [Fusarium oxysporum f. sp. conglutinans race 2 54008]